MLQNENKLDEMSIILERFIQLVPTLPQTSTQVLPNGDKLESDDTKFAPDLIGGDQLTVARVRGTQALGTTEKKVVDRLGALLAVIEDWHTRMAAMKVYT